MTQGGYRKGAGRKPGKTTDKTELLGKRLTPAEKAALTAYLMRLRGEKKE